MTTKVEIIIRKKRKPHQSNQPVRGPIVYSPRAEYLPRRKGFTTFNFYDRAQITNGLGGWQDIDYYKQPSIALSRFRNPSNFWKEQIRATVGRFRAADWSDYFDYIFTEPVSNWKNLYRRIDYVTYDPYSPSMDLNGRGVPTSGVGFVTATPPTFDTSGNKLVWTTDGMKAKEKANYFSMFALPHPYFYFDVNDLSKYKFTATRNYSDPAATIHFGKTCNVYLIPRLTMMIGTSRKVTATGGSNYTLDNAYLNGVFIPYPRNMHPAHRDPTLTGHPVTDPTGYYHDFAAWLKGRPYSRITQMTRHTTGSPPGFVTPTTIDFNGAGSTWPLDEAAEGWQIAFMTELYDAGPVTSTVFDVFEGNIKSIVDEDFPTTGDLGFFEIPSSPMVVGVIETNGQYYYAWTTDPFWNYQQIDHLLRKPYVALPDTSPSDSPFNIIYNNGW
jgi:hypothetical protein